MNRWLKNLTAYGLVLVALALPLMGGLGCGEYADEFRAAAAPSLRTGVDALVDGFVEGVFAVIEPDEKSESDGNSP